ncbi:MAG: hypothetical protein F6K63_34360 [Moorea sp. SIO1G6]|uniref:hypothetical protein n=1 Tax=Moorena sp. SIO1G6 TaxID=2607840 RepID=UPI0013BF1C2D|nr:hypothetical protein [Moorena sp. SIO1G6]NES84080.1 hypothetical protein [Moorena sp. SIO2B7]NET69210.1 hypothetical protein [Moorena sp. SIO1G6]
MVSALISSGKLSQCAWEPYVLCLAKQAQSFERRWHRFVSNRLIGVVRLVPIRSLGKPRGMDWGIRED